MSETAKIILVLFQLLTIASALLVTFSPNILYASISLLFAFLGVAIMFLYAGADFLAGVQVIVYIGGVTILVLFAIMLTSWMYQVKLRDSRAKLIVPLLLALFGLLPFLYQGAQHLASRVLRTVPPDFEAFAFSPKTNAVGEALLGNYLLPFEGITVLLLGALVGAVWLARPK
ncbi:MAG: NADH-quinone oxidoreductase subunit J [Bdellovibrionaceae bacterium]|nr:NADH-quinone oxidoreductase subunit J [Bdellovibrionales bacterium]MCB9253081.1 NADH-quinone oxidoreductase subunit J [Pseudobdellovibrionaceae bacterium]